jgi:hypothetical protein
MLWPMQVPFYSFYCDWGILVVNDPRVLRLDAWRHDASLAGTILEVLVPRTPSESHLVRG